MKTCYQHHVISKCDCADPYVEKYGAAFNYGNMSSCDVRNATQCKQTYDQEHKFILNFNKKQPIYLFIYVCTRQ